MLCKPWSLLSPRHRWKASLGAPQGALEMLSGDASLTQDIQHQAQQDPRHPGILSDCWIPSENRQGERGEVKIELIPQNNRAWTAAIFHGLFPTKPRIEQECFLGSEEQVPVAKKDQSNYSASPSSISFNGAKSHPTFGDPGVTAQDGVRPISIS